jgi:hypothetical protein
MALLVVVFLISVPVLAQAPPAHDREFWRAIVKNRYAVLVGQSSLPLMRELSGYLGSRDPELRDDLAYTILATWIVDKKQLSAVELNAFADEWRANLRIPGSESGTDGVLLRSFSALCLAALAEREVKEPFLGEERYRSLLADALAFLKNEHDLRGFDPVLGWIHATAHTADLLTALADSPMFQKEDQGRVLEAISGRLSSAHEIFTFGEQDRLALAVATIVRRKDFDPQVFFKWLNAMDSADRLVWRDSPPKLELLQTLENNSYMLRALAAHLSKGSSEGAPADALAAVLKSLQRR